MKKWGRYPKEFKIEAVRLLNLGDKPASELAGELDVKRTLKRVSGTFYMDE